MNRGPRRQRLRLLVSLVLAAGSWWLWASHARDAPGPTPMDHRAWPR